jgi:threonine synthase
MGLPVATFVASTNINDVVPEYLASGKFNPRTSLQTISNAMDVGNPSNFVRILDLFQGDFDRISSEVVGYAFTDDETRSAMRQIFGEKGYVMDPHGAVAYLGLKKFLENRSDVTGIFTETAHPAKFMDVVEKTLNSSIQIPEKLQKFMTLKKHVIEMPADYGSLKDQLLTMAV